MNYAECYEHLTVFFTNGTTARFYRVTDVEIGPERIYFRYISASDGKTNTACIQRASIAIHSFAGAVR